MSDNFALKNLRNDSLFSQRFRRKELPAQPTFQVNVNNSSNVGQALNQMK